VWWPASLSHLLAAVHADAHLSVLVLALLQVTKYFSRQLSQEATTEQVVLQGSSVQYGAVSTIQYSTIQHSTAPVQHTVR
jgi:hypothetical protein